MINIIDNNMYNLISQLINQKNTIFMLAITHLGSAITFITLTLAFILLFKNKKDAKYITVNLILVFILNRILKFIIARPRPNVLKLVYEKGYSFPSGHAMTSMAFYGFLIYLTHKNINNKKIKYILEIILSLLILLIGISRVYLGAHYATDVIGAIVISIIYLTVFIKFIYKKDIIKGKKESREIWIC